jgi:hypothetical protein
MSSKVAASVSEWTQKEFHSLTLAAAKRGNLLVAVAAVLAACLSSIR